MKHLKYLPLFFCLVFIESCVIDRPCKNASNVCPDTYASLFRITSKTDGKDLIYGPHKLYDKSEIKIFSVRGTDTAFANYQPYRLVQDAYDSVLFFRLASKVDTLFIRLSTTDTDTIALSYGVSEGRCCSFNSIRTLGYNGTASLPNYNGTVVFKK